jgi:hypothetical protein
MLFYAVNNKDIIFSLGITNLGVMVLSARMTKETAGGIRATEGYTGDRR